MNQVLKKRMAGVARNALAAAAVSAVAVSSAFAQSSGSGTATGISDGPILTAINSVTPVIVDIGGAVLAVVVVAWGYKTVKGFLGR